MSPRERFDALTAEQRGAVVEVLRVDLERGWIPSDADLWAVMARVAEGAEQPARSGAEQH